MAYENNIYDKITHWFEVIGKVLKDPAILLIVAACLIVETGCLGVII